MRNLQIALNLQYTEMPKRKDFRIGCIGAGFIMRDCHLVAYQDAGFYPYAIASRTFANAQEVAKKFQISKVYETWEELIQDPDIEILDIAFPPDQQLPIVREAVKQKHIKGILCQKPLAMNFWKKPKRLLPSVRRRASSWLSTPICAMTNRCVLSSRF